MRALHTAPGVHYLPGDPVSNLRARLAHLTRTYQPQEQGRIEVWLVNDDDTQTNTRTGETLTTAELDARGGFIIDLTSPEAR